LPSFSGATTVYRSKARASRATGNKPLPAYVGRFTHRKKSWPAGNKSRPAGVEYTVAHNFVFRFPANMISGEFFINSDLSMSAAN
jgi:hypothetical protein